MDLGRAKRILALGIRLRCPACGKGRLFARFYKMNDKCPHCGLVFVREQGYFIGAIYVNVIVTESLIGLTFLLGALVFDVPDTVLYSVLFALALTLPVAFYRHARSLWLSIDYIMDPPKRPDTGPFTIR
jgi:uncharacterized protein (DUF983 family)